MKEGVEYKELEGQAKVRGSVRVAQEAGGPRQTGERPPLEQDGDNSRKEPPKKSQEGASSSSTDYRRDPENEQRQIDPKERKKSRHCKKSPSNRSSREWGRVTGRIRGPEPMEGTGGGGIPRR